MYDDSVSESDRIALEEEKRKILEEWKETKEQKRCRQWEEDYMRVADVKEQRKFKELEATRVYYGQERQRKEKEREKDKKTLLRQYKERLTMKDKAYSASEQLDRSLNEEPLFPLDTADFSRNEEEGGTLGTVILNPTGADSDGSDDVVTSDSDASDEEEDSDQETGRGGRRGSGGGEREERHQHQEKPGQGKKNKKPKTYHSAEDVLSKIDKDTLMHLRKLSPPTVYDDEGSMPRCGSFSSLDDHLSSTNPPASPPPITRTPSTPPPLEVSSSMQEFPVARRAPVSLWKGGEIPREGQPQQQQSPPTPTALHESHQTSRTRRGTTSPVVHLRKKSEEEGEHPKSRNKARPNTVDTPAARKSPLSKEATTTTPEHSNNTTSGASSEEGPSLPVSPKESSEKESERESSGRESEGGRSSEGERSKKRKKIRRKKRRDRGTDEEEEGEGEEGGKDSGTDGENIQHAQQPHAQHTQQQHTQHPQQKHRRQGARRLVQQLSDDQATCIVIFGSEISNNVCLSILLILLFVYVFARYLS